jgi:hypothetical protein
MTEAKPYAIPKQIVWDAYRRSRRIAERPVWTVNRWWTSRKT